MGHTSTVVLAVLLLLPVTAYGQSGKTGGGAAPERTVPAKGSLPMPGWTATYVTEGKGRPCIVVSLRNYHQRSFSDRFKGELRCTFLDARFTAPEATVDPKSPYTIAAAVEDLEAARKKLGIDRFVLVGHSIQGSIALAYALRYPQHVSHVIAIGAVAELSPAQEKLAKEYWERNASPERKAAFAADQKAFEAAAPGLAPADVVPAQIRADAAQRWADFGYDERPLMKDATLSLPVLMELFGQPFTLFPPASRIEPPALVVVGRQDFAAPPTSWDGRKGSFRDLTLVVLEQAGHTPQVEVRDAFDDAVVSWLRSH